MNNNLNDVVENVCYSLWRHDAGLRVLADSLDEFISWPATVKDSVANLIWNTAHFSIERSIEGAVDTAAQACVREAVYNYFNMNFDKIISRDEYLLRL